jgi:preprotein translocase subunit SecG
MITTIMAAFAFGYCVTDIVLNYLNKREYDKLMKTTIENHK